jgi:hypothetical protein
MPKPKKLKTTSTPTLADKGYSDFIRSLDLRSLGLTTCSSTLDRDAFFRLYAKGAQPARRLIEAYRVARVGTDFFDAEGRFQVILSTRKEANKPALMIDCVFTAHIHAEEPVSADFAKRFADSELWIVMLPYARHLITDITAQMAIPPIVIPLASRR